MELIFVGVGALVVLTSMFLAYVVYEKNAICSGGETRSFSLYIFGLIGSSILASGVVGKLLLDRICSENSGAGCAFGVLAITQPFLMCIGIAAFMFIWVKVKS